MAEHPLEASRAQQRIADVGQLRTMLASYRRAAGMTQADLAVRLGVTKSRISQIETGPERVTVAQFLAVLRALKVEIRLSQKGDTASLPDHDEGW